MIHIHAKEIIAWANGAEIEIKLECCWVYIDKPTWELHREYRVKPVPKPDQILERGLFFFRGGAYVANVKTPNIRMTFDRENLKLIKVEMIK